MLPKTLCQSCLRSLLSLPKALDNEQCFSALPYQKPASSLIQHIKYGGSHHQSAFLLLYLAFENRLIRSEFIHWIVENQPTLIPIPRNPMRLFRYGTNSSFLLAQSLSKRFSLKLKPFVSRKFWKNSSQLGETSLQRSEYVQNIFLLKKEITGPILLIDDVLTTGSTLWSATSLFEAQKTRFLTLVHTQAKKEEDKDFKPL